MAVDLVRPYCTLAQVQAEARNTRAADEDKISGAINTASRWIEEHCRADFWYHDHLTTLLTIPNDWVVGPDIYFPWPIISLTKLEDITTLASPSDIHVDDYQLETGINSLGVVERRGIVRSSGRLPLVNYQNSLRVTGTFGFTLISGSEASETPPTNLPAAVNRACVLAAATFSGLYHRQWKEPGVGGGVQEMLQSNLPTEVTTLLKRWRRPVA